MRKELSRRRFLQTSVLGMGALGLAACAPKATPVPTAVPESGSESEAQPVATAAPADKEPTQLTYQVREEEVPEGMMLLWEEWYPEFREQNPDIEVEYLSSPQDQIEGLLAQMVAGTCSDVVEIADAVNARLFIDRGDTLNLQPLIDRDAKVVNIDDFYDGQFDVWKDGSDNIQLLPRFTGTCCVFYNKAMFDEMGVEYPSTEWGGWTLDDYRAISKEFVRREAPMRWGTSNYGFWPGWLAMMYMRGFGAHLSNPEDWTESMLCEQESMDCFEYLRAFIWDDHGMAYGAEKAGMGPQQLFLGEKIAMMDMGPWGLGQVLEGATFEWDVASFPSGPVSATNYQSLDGSFIWNGTETQEETWTLLKGLTSPHFEELYAKYGQKQPSRKSVVTKFPQIMREHDERYNQIALEVFGEATVKGIGGGEDVYLHDAVSKNQILSPAFDKVLMLGDAAVDLICKAGEIVTRYNRDEITIDQIGAELEDIGLYADE